MQPQTTIRALLLTAGATLCGSAAAGENGPSVSFDARVGYQYDSNVSIEEIDTSTGEADGALLLDAGMAARIPIAERLTLALGYDLSNTAYRAYSGFDTAIHHGQAELAYRLPWVDAALTFDRFHVRLDDEGFMDVEQLAPSIARLFGESLYLRGSYTRGQKANAASPDRDADNEAFRVDAYVLFDGMNHYLAFNHRIGEEDARADELDYSAHRSGLTWGRRLPVGERHLHLKSRLQMERRDYLNVTESIGTARNDERLRAGLGATLTLSEHLDLQAEAEYADNRSNLPAADFDEMVYSVSVGASF